MILITNGHDYIYEVQSIINIFIPGVKIVHKEQLDQDYKGDFVVSTLNPDSHTVEVEINFSGKYEKKSVIINSLDKDEVEYEFAVIIYNIMKPLTGVDPKWGILTGIRPVKLAQKKIKIGWNDEQVKDHFINKIFVHQDRAELMLDTAKQGRKAFSLIARNSFSLYIGIPFCPSRCGYCSFVSHSIERTAKLIPEYIDKLCKEIEYVSNRAKQSGLVLSTIYIGGGTPTSLTEQQLTQIFDCVKNNYDLSNILEYTVEAGRADTITPEKLLAIKQSGATRISINPQTLNDDVLQAIGRKHSVQQVYDSYKLAREMGFDDINMDLIAGLNTESLQSFQNSIDGVIDLCPENITIHTLAVKRSSDNAISGDAIFEAKGGLASQMMEYAYNSLQKADYTSYYLYRQRNMRDNLENVGFGKKDKMGLYNIYTMEDIQTIIACGAGAVTKLYNSETGKIVRIFNYKFPYEYLSGFETLLERKNKINTFLGK